MRKSCNPVISLVSGVSCIRCLLYPVLCVVVAEALARCSARESLWEREGMSHAVVDRTCVYGQPARMHKDMCCLGFVRIRSRPRRRASGCLQAVAAAVANVLSVRLKHIEVIQAYPSPRVYGTLCTPAALVVWGQALEKRCGAASAVRRERRRTYGANESLGELLICGLDPAFSLVSFIRVVRQRVVMPALLVAASAAMVRNGCAASEMDYVARRDTMLVQFMIESLLFESILAMLLLPWVWFRRSALPHPMRKAICLRPISRRGVRRSAEKLTGTLQAG
jgi:hypothetical protein